MKKILVPTDFSYNAEKALEYALHLAIYFKSEIVLLHAWDLPHQKSSMFVSMQDMIKKKAEEDIKELKEKIADRFPELTIKTALIMGNASESIKSVAKNLQADLIVMGTKGASGITKYLWGSIASGVIDGAPCPVFAVPEKATYQNIRKIGFATDYNQNDGEVILNLIPLVKLFNAELIIAHIGKEKGPDENGTHRLAEKMSSQSGYNNIIPLFIENPNVLDGINNLIEEQNLNILAVAKVKRNFFDGIFHKSVSQEVAFSSKIPLMVFQSSAEVADKSNNDKAAVSTKNK
jgi:nucleotide-binding universal stress UspA family protein